MLKRRHFITSWKILAHFDSNPSQKKMEQEQQKAGIVIGVNQKQMEEHFTVN